MERHTGGDGDQFPILDTEWLVEGEIDLEAYQFLEENGPPSSVEAAPKVVRAGDKVANKNDDVRQAARLVQEIHMWDISALSKNA